MVDDRRYVAVLGLGLVLQTQLAIKARNTAWLWASTSGPSNWSTVWKDALA